jgi:hypothetical protein
VTHTLMYVNKLGQKKNPQKYIYIYMKVIATGGVWGNT